MQATFSLFFISDRKITVVVFSVKYKDALHSTEFNFKQDLGKTMQHFRIGFVFVPGTWKMENISTTSRQCFSSCVSH